MTIEKLAPEVNTILTAKRKALAERKRTTPLSAVRALASMQTRAVPFMCTIPGDGSPLLIGQIRYGDFEPSMTYDPVAQAVRYVHGGADAIALFTDDTIYAGGIDDLMFVARAVQSFNIPVITQDYIVDEYQVIEARAGGAAALVLDAGIIDADKLRALLSTTQRNRMTAIVAVGDEREMASALALSPQVIALGSSAVADERPDMAQVRRLRTLIPGHVNILFNGDQATLEDAVEAARMGVDAIILGEKLATDLNALRPLLGRRDQAR